VSSRQPKTPGKAKRARSSATARTLRLATSTTGAGTRSPSQRLRILITGFGPFPGAPDNPTGPLVRALARNHRTTSGVTIKAHVFQTRYSVVDRALPRLLKSFRPDALVMFGLANRSRAIRVETLARNRIAATPDAGGTTLGPGKIDKAAPPRLAVRAPAAALLRAVERTGLPVRLSRSAGDYVCNYTLWRATRAATEPQGPKLAAFIHVPLVSARWTEQSLEAAGGAVLQATVSALRRRRA
jgi:pyroglutamyl-peptidase